MVVIAKVDETALGQRPAAGRRFCRVSERTAAHHPLALLEVLLHPGVQEAVCLFLAFLSECGAPVSRARTSEVGSRSVGVLHRVGQRQHVLLAFAEASLVEELLLWHGAVLRR